MPSAEPAHYPPEDEKRVEQPERREGAPSYDTSKEDYAGIASGSREGGLQGTEDFADMIVDTVREGLLVLDLDLRVTAANESFYATFSVRPEETLGRLVYDLGSGQWDLPRLRELLEEILPEKKVMDEFEVTHDFEDIGPRYMLLNARQLDEHQMILLVIEDVTERRKTERELQRLTDELEARVEEVRELASTLTMAEQAERRRISQTLHDDLQQQLYGIQMKMSFIRQHAEAGRTGSLLEDIDEAEALLSEGVEITRNLTVDLSPPILRSEGLADTIVWLQSRMKELHDFDVNIESDQPFQTPDDDLRVLLFQIVRELLFNVVRHAGTKQATVELRDADEHVEIAVVDRGKGFDVDAVEARDEGGFGLFSVRERIGLFGGTMEIDSAPGKGTRIVLSVPLRLT